MKKLLGIGVIGFCGITGNRLETGEIKQELYQYERRKGASTLENHTGSWRLFTWLAGHLG